MESASQTIKETMKGHPSMKLRGATPWHSTQAGTANEHMCIAVYQLHPMMSTSNSNDVLFKHANIAPNSREAPEGRIT